MDIVKEGDIKKIIKGLFGELCRRSKYTYKIESYGDSRRKEDK